VSWSISPGMPSIALLATEKCKKKKKQKTRLAAAALSDLGTSWDLLCPDCRIDADPRNQTRGGSDFSAQIDAAEMRTVQTSRVTLPCLKNVRRLLRPLTTSHYREFLQRLACVKCSLQLETYFSERYISYLASSTAVSPSVH